MKHAIDLPRLPISLRLLLTAFLTLLGAGYLSALANIYYRHQLADGTPGLSMNDLRAVYSGLPVDSPKDTRKQGEVSSQKSADSADAAERPSRMLTMIRGEMRQYFSSDADFAVLENWLAKGGRLEGMDAGEGRRTPRKILVRDCLRCHGQSTGSAISKQSPFGPDEFEIDYERISRFLPAAGKPGDAARTVPQYTIERLVLVTHVHMLSIPLFTLAVSLLFANTRFPTRFRDALVPIPMTALLIDFAGWWIARAWGPGVWLLWFGGAIFGVAFGLQVIAVAIDLWRPIAPAPKWDSAA